MKIEMDTERLNDVLDQIRNFGKICELYGIVQVSGINPSKEETLRMMVIDRFNDIKQMMVKGYLE